MDGNGREELPVAHHVTEDSYSLIGLYVLVNDVPVTVDNTVGDRSHLTLIGMDRSGFPVYRSIILFRRLLQAG